jgi:hypothetical protein
VTGADGTFRIAGIRDARCDLMVGSDYQGHGDLVLTGGTGVAVPSEGVEVVASDGVSIAGVVRDESDHPVAGVEVSADPPVHNVVRSSTTDGEGRFRIDHLRADRRYAIEATMGGHAPGTASDVAPGRTDVIVRLTGAAEITGRLRDADGHALARTTIKLAAKDGHDVSVETDAGGRFRASGLRDAVYAITVEQESGDDLHVADAAAGSRDLELVLPGGK